LNSGLKYGLVAVALLFAVPVGCSLIGGASSVATAPGRVVSATMQTDNVINSYQGFFTRKVTYDARVSQIAGHVKLVADNTDPSEASRLRIELSAMRASCREMALTYNADAAMANKGLFRDGDLPETLAETACEA